MVMVKRWVTRSRYYSNNYNILKFVSDGVWKVHNSQIYDTNRIHSMCIGLEEIQVKH